MSEQRKSDLMWLAAILVVAVPITAYIAGYFWLGTSMKSEPRGLMIVREYGYDWLAAAYSPLGRVEAPLRGIPIVILGPKAEYAAHP